VARSASLTYRENAPPPPERPKRLVTARLRRRGLAWTVFVVAFALAGAFAAWTFQNTAVTVRCERRASGETPLCVATEHGLFAGEAPQRFEAGPLSLAWARIDAGDDGTTIQLQLGGTLFQASNVSEREADAFMAAYQAYVADRDAGVFERTEGPGSPWAWVLWLAVVGPVGWAFWSVDERTKVVLDLDGNELRVEVGRWLVAPRVSTFDWTEFERLRSESFDTEEEDVERLVGETKSGRTELLVVAGDRDTKRAAERLTKAMTEERARRKAEEELGA